MRALRPLWPFAATFALGLVGLLVHGPAGDVAAFVWLGVFPGLALARLLLPGATPATRWTLGVALAPLTTALCGWALVSAGQPLPVAARIVAIGGWLLFAGGEARAPGASPRSPADAPGDRHAWAWVLAAAAFVALPVLLNVYIRVRSDTWVHAGLVWEISERGFPPQDPRFAGLPLNYVWFYNLFIAMLTALRAGSSPFTHIATANVCWMAVQMWLGWHVAWAVWRDRAAARAALPLLWLGLNAGALLFYPLWLMRALIGDVRGLPEVRRMLEYAHWDSTEVLHQLCAPLARMVNAWDKFAVGTALGYAWLMLLVTLWAATRWLGDERGERTAGEPPAWRWLLVVFAGASGMMLFHSVVGLSAIPVGVGACVLLALLAGRVPALGPGTRPLALAAAMLAGLAATLPYFIGIAKGWAPDQSGFQHHYLHLDWRMPWTLLTSCGMALAMAWPVTRRAFAERNVRAVFLACWALGMTAFAVVVNLPDANESKFAWQVFAPLALLGGAGFVAWLGEARRRLGVPLFAALFAVCFVLPPALFQFGYLSDRPVATAPELARAPGEPELYAWIREHTPVDAVFADHLSRDVLLVEGRRRLLAGTPYSPERAAFPRAALLRRRAVMADLYGAVEDLAGDAACLDSLRAPAFVLYRAADFPTSTPWTALDADSGSFERVYAAGGHRVYRRRS